jgi:hypothetical protein
VQEKSYSVSWGQWLTSVIPATGKAEIRDREDFDSRPHCAKKFKRPPSQQKKVG